MADSIKSEIERRYRYAAEQGRDARILEKKLYEIFPADFMLEDFQFICVSWYGNVNIDIVCHDSDDYGFIARTKKKFEKHNFVFGKPEKASFNRLKVTGILNELVYDELSPVLARVIITGPPTEKCLKIRQTIKHEAVQAEAYDETVESFICPGQELPEDCEVIGKVGG